jgi:hypothetical protein
MRHPALTATWWGGAGLLGGAATGVLVLLPLYPEDDSGFEGLGWFLMAMALGALLGLVAGAALLLRGLRRAGAAHPGRTALAFVPIAVLLASVTAGAGALAAPALAHWVVDGFTRRPGWGPVRAGGLAQRLVVTLVVSAGLASWALATLGAELGGRVGGGWLIWAAALPAVVAPPLLLLRAVLPWRVLVAWTGAAALLLALAAPGATRNAHPTPDRLEQIARDLPVPPGQDVTALRSSVLRNISWDVPVTLLSTGGPVPALGSPLPADARGVAAARQWEAVLVEEGWVRTSQQDTSTYWLPDPARGTLEEQPLYELGLWTRAAVVPYHDGALVLLSVRP